MSDVKISKKKIKKENNVNFAVRAIIIFGIISLLGDMVYESARGSNSQYFELIGISAAKVGLVFGIGEFLGYFLRLISGVISDKSKKPWAFMFIGYGMLFFVPLMGFTQNWNVLFVLILMERIGKAIRNPSKDTVLSAISENQVGVGFAFGLQEALDQVGAFLGPLIFTAVFYFTGKNTLAEYSLGYKFLFIPFVLLMLFLYYSYRVISKGNLLGEEYVREFKSEKLKPIFWMYMAFTFFATLGFLNFSTLGYHMKSQNILTDGKITLIYSVAMIVDALTALIVGRLYDKLKEKSWKKNGGILVLGAIPVVTLLLPFFGLTMSKSLIIVSMIIFGIIMGTHETIMRSAIADITPFDKRGTGYGVFNTGYGLALFLGATITGYLYDKNLNSIILIITVVCEIIAMAIFIKMKREIQK